MCALLLPGASPFLLGQCLVTIHCVFSITDTVYILCLSGASPFLLGQCLVTASRFGGAMNVTQTQSFLQATVTGLLSTQPPVVRTSALRSVGVRSPGCPRSRVSRGRVTGLPRPAHVISSTKESQDIKPSEKLSTYGRAQTPEVALFGLISFAGVSL